MQQYKDLGYLLPSYFFEGESCTFMSNVSNVVTVPAPSHTPPWPSLRSGKGVDPCTWGSPPPIYTPPQWGADGRDPEEHWTLTRAWLPRSLPSCSHRGPLGLRCRGSPAAAPR